MGQCARQQLAGRCVSVIFMSEGREHTVSLSKAFDVHRMLIMANSP